MCNGKMWRFAPIFRDENPRRPKKEKCVPVYAVNVPGGEGCSEDCALAEQSYVFGAGARAASTQKREMRAGFRRGCPGRRRLLRRLCACRTVSRVWGGSPRRVDPKKRNAGPVCAANVPGGEGCSEDCELAEQSHAFGAGARAASNRKKERRVADAGKN